MSRQASVLSVLIASPMDVAEYRDALERGVQLWNRGPLSRHLNVVLEVLRWEHDAVPMLGEGDAQQVINQQLAAEADIVVAIFHSRLGSPTQRHPSGTAEEIDIAVTRRVPVHVYVDKSPLPEGHKPEQHKLLTGYLKELVPQGLLAEFRGQQQLLELVRHALEHDIAQLLQNSSADRTASAGTASGSLRDRLNAAADVVLTAEVYQPGISFDGADPNEVFRRRHDQLRELAAPLLEAVIDVARHTDDEANELLVELLDVLAPNPCASGRTGLIDQTRFVSALSFHVAGVVACSAGNDRLVGMLLAAEPTVTEPTRGPVPMATCFRPGTATAGGEDGSKALKDTLAELLVPVLGDGTFNRAWEAWTYLSSVVNTYFRAAGIAAANTWPYLLVRDLHTGRELTIDVAARVRTRLDKAGEAHPTLQAGFCGGAHDLFTQAADTFESGYGKHAEDRDHAALPYGGGWLPSGLHYPGER